MRFCVVGGMNLDVTGQFEGEFRLHDSNPGRVSFSAGGVGRNIACALKKLGHEVSLVSVLTGDLMGRFLYQDCLAQGIDTSCSINAVAGTGAYISIHTPEGEMLAGVNDMGAMSRITPLEINARAEFINGFDAVVCEANLSSEALKALAEHAKNPLIADAVSVYKCERLIPVLPYLNALKLNIFEARALTGEAEAKDAGQALLRRGVKCVLVSLGDMGAYACDKNSDAFLSPERAYICQTTGAGDAMCAGFAAGVARGLGAVKSAALGMDEAQKLLKDRSAK